MNIGIRFKKARENAKLTQEQVAEKFGISRNAVSLWESNGSNRTQPDSDKLIVLANLYKVDVSELLEGEESRSPKKQDGKKDFSEGKVDTLTSLTPDQLEMLALMESINSEDRKAWLKLGASLAKSNKSAVSDLSKPQSDHGVNDERVPVELKYIETDTYKGPGRRRHFGIPPDMKRLRRKTDTALKRDKNE